MALPSGGQAADIIRVLDMAGRWVYRDLSTHTHKYILFRCHPTFELGISAEGRETFVVGHTLYLVDDDWILVGNETDPGTGRLDAPIALAIEEERAALTLSDAAYALPPERFGFAGAVRVALRAIADRPAAVKMLEFVASRPGHSAALGDIDRGIRGSRRLTADEATRGDRAVRRLAERTRDALEAARAPIAIVIRRGHVACVSHP